MFVCLVPAGLSGPNEQPHPGRERARSQHNNAERNLRGDAEQVPAGDVGDAVSERAGEGSARRAGEH